MTGTVCQDQRVGCYPGSFDPPTIAHLAIAVMARRAAALDRIDLVVSEIALDKPAEVHAPFDVRLAVIEASIAHAPWLGLVVTDKQLIVDIAAGYDMVVMGADKWAQIHDARYYGNDAARRDEAIAALPPVALFDRPGHDAGDAGAFKIELPARLVDVSSSAARSGRADWMTPPARKTAEAHGLWGVGPAKP